MNPNALHALGKAGASEEFAQVAGADHPTDGRNLPKLYAELSYAEVGAVSRPGQDALERLWDGDVKQAYRSADTDLAILLESVFSDVRLGLVAQSTTNRGYTTI